MAIQRSEHSLSRRSTLAGLGVASVSLALAPMAHRVIAQEATPGPSVAMPAAEGQMAAINGVELYYEVRGDPAGTPVLLLHGGLGNTEEWNNLSPALVDAGYRVVVMDCRGRGRSSWDGKPITFELMASDALALLDHVEIDRTHLVGWSDGGVISLELAITHPERLNKVVAYGARFTPDGVYAEARPSDQLVPFETFVEDYQRLSPEPERFEELLGVMLSLYTVAPNFGETELRSISVPVLVLAGAEEELIKPDQPPGMAKLIPGAELTIMPGTGHFAPFTQPAEFNRIVLDFLMS